MERKQRLDPALADTCPEQTLVEGTISEADLLRLKAAAHLHARGLPAGIGWTDLLHEAVLRMLDGSRLRPEGVPLVAFLAGVMRSIRAEHWRRLKREREAFPARGSRRDFADAQDEQPPDPAPDPEQRLAAFQELAAISQLFAQDVQALRILGGLAEGLSAEEIRMANGMTKTEYDSARKRMRRVLLREGLVWRQP